MKGIKFESFEMFWNSLTDASKAAFATLYVLRTDTSHVKRSILNSEDEAVYSLGKFVNEVTHSDALSKEEYGSFFNILDDVFNAMMSTFEAEARGLTDPKSEWGDIPRMFSIMAMKALRLD